MSQNGNNLVTLNVDGKDYQAVSGSNLIDALSGLGIEVPHYCYHPKLTVVGNCRMCMVEMGTPMVDRATNKPMVDESGKPKIGWMPKPAIACSTKVTPGLHVRTQSAMTKAAREGVMEFLLVNHPLDCPICDQAGECSLQEFATDYGRGYSRFTDEKNVKPKKVKIGERVTLDNERCILCSRCVRFCEEIDKNPVLGITQRGSLSTIACHPGKKLDSNYSLNTVDICPVGALTSTDFRFKMRVWFLKRTASICTESSTGVNTEVWSREGVIYRITPRRNDSVNDTWMPDSGRLLYKQVAAENRIKSFAVDGQAVVARAAFARVRELVSRGRVAIVANGHASVEECYHLRRLAEALKASVHFVHHRRESDNRLISNDATPNLRGALLTRLIDQLPAETLEPLTSQVAQGEITTIISVNQDLTSAGFTAELLRKASVIAVATHDSPTTAAAKVLLPSLTVFEKSGTFVNQQFRLQRFESAVSGPEAAMNDRDIFTRIHSDFESVSHTRYTVEQTWPLLSASVPELSQIAFTKIPDEGILLNDSAFRTLPFKETQGWHYKPSVSVQG